MKVIITNDSLDSLLSVQISTNGGQSYSTYSVSSLKDGLTFDCSPKDLKVICDVNTLKYIQVLADGEKASSSDIDLSNYIKIKDIYVDLYKNTYYGSKDLSDEERRKLSDLERMMYDNKDYRFYCNGEGFEPEMCSKDLRVAPAEVDDYWNSGISFDYDFHNSWRSNNGYYYYFINNEDILIDAPYFNLICPDCYGYIDDNTNHKFLINERIHFIKHF